MTDLPRRLKRLDAMIGDLIRQGGEPMLLSQFDGFVAGLIVCPDLIPPGEWLPLVWNVEDIDTAPLFEDSQRFEAFVKLVMEHYNETIRDLDAGRYAPVFDVDERHDETLWETWMEGFELAASLRPESWDSILAGADETQLALAGLILLGDVARGESRLPEEELRDMAEHAPDLISFWLRVLHLARGKAVPSPVTKGPKVGRNDPCLCGSGRKHKMCCGRN